MFDKRRKIQEVRESFLDTDELLQSIGQKQRGRQVATGASTQDSITNAFEQFIDYCTDSGGSEVTDGQNYSFEGGNGKRNSMMNSSLNKSLDKSANFDEDATAKVREDYYQSLLNKSPNRIESLDLFLLLDDENDQFLKYSEIRQIWPFI